MSIKSIGAKIFAKIIKYKIDKWSEKPVETQQKVFDNLIKSGTQTLYGKDFHFEKITDFKSFAEHIPIQDYESLKPYVEKAVEGESDILCALA